MSVAKPRLNKDTALRLPPMSADDLRELCGLGLAALFDFEAQNRPVFFRGARELMEPDNQPNPPDEECFPTATAHALLALIDTGVKTGASLPSDSTRVVVERTTESGVRIPGSDQDILKSFSMHARVREFLTHNPREGEAAENGQTWLERICATSSHWNMNEGDEDNDGEGNRPDPKPLIVLGHVVPAMIFAVQRSELVDRESLQDNDRAALNYGLKASIDQVANILDYSEDSLVSRDIDGMGYRPYIQRYQPTDPTEPSDHTPTYLLLNAACVVESVLKRDDYLKHADNEPNILPEPTRALAQQMFRDLGHCFYRRVERGMAARDIPDDTTFDPLGLAFAARGWALCDRGVRERPLFREAIAAVAKRQVDDGCWPDGAATDDRQGVATQQPSIEVAFNLAAAAYSREMRTRPTESDLTLLDAVRAPLQRYARFLELTWNNGGDPTTPRDGGRFSGWASDRSRASRNAETWITALAVRFLHFTALIVEAKERARIQRDYKIEIRRRRTARSAEHLDPCGSFRSEVVEPDQITKPVEAITKQFIEPIAKKIREDRYVTRPDKDGVSLLLFGPPRSG